MRKQVFIVTSAILALFMLAGCGEPEKESNENIAAEQNENPVEENITNGSDRLEEAKNFANSLEAEKEALDKYKEITGKSTNPDDCNVISDEYYLNACKNQVIINSVNETMDISLCDNISDEQIKTDCRMIQPAN